MDNDNDPLKMGEDFQKWSDLDNLLPKLKLHIELFRHNVWIAGLVILSGLLRADQQQRQEYLTILTPRHFDAKSLPRFLFEKIAAYPFKVNETIPEVQLEKWITEFHAEIWGELPPEPRMFHTNNLTLRQILNIQPTKEQVYQAIELRKERMEKRGY